MSQRVPPVPANGPDMRWYNTLVATVNDAYAGTTTTAQRPPKPVIGQHYFDTSLGVPIWCKSLNPTVWVNGTGTVV